MDEIFKGIYVAGWIIFWFFSFVGAVSEEENNVEIFFIGFSSALFATVWPLFAISAAIGSIKRFNN